MPDWRIKREEMDAALKSLAVPLLREMGFRGSYPHFRRLLQHRVDALGFQFSNWGPQFYIELGVSSIHGTTMLDGAHYPAKNIKYYQCLDRKRIGKLPFDFEFEDPDVIAQLAYQAIDAAKLEWENLYTGDSY